MAEYSSYAPNPELQTPVTAPPVVTPTPATTPVAAPVAPAAPANVANPYDSSRKDYSNLQYLLNQGVTADQINSQLALGKKGAANGSFVDPQDVGKFLSAYNINPQQAYSASNVAQTVNGVVSRPDLSDPLGLYDYYLNSADIKKAQGEYQTAADATNKATQMARNRQTALENLPQALNVIRGEQAQASRLSSDEIAALSENQLAKQSYLTAIKETATNKFNIAKSMRDELTQMIVNNPGAKITYADTTDSASSKIQKYQDQVAKDEYKKSLKSMAMQLGIKTSGSRKELEKRISKYYKGEADIKSQLQQLELAAKRKSLSGGGTAPGASSELSATASAFAKFSGDWELTAKYLADKGYDVGEGSTIDNELRRRNGLSPISTATNKPLTQAQYTVAGYANRAAESSGILNNFSDLGSSALGYVSGNQKFPNILKSSDRQQMEQAQRNFVNAILRRESGAVISPSEFENAAQQYFPQPGDNPAVIQQKEANRDMVIKNLTEAAGGASQGLQLGEQDINDIITQFGL